VALGVLEKIFKGLACFCGFSLPFQIIFGILEPFKQILNRPTQCHSCQKLEEEL
jgi:hypothetical protein